MPILEVERPRNLPLVAGGGADIRLAGLSYVAGAPRPIDSWCAQKGHGPEVVRQLSQAGLRFLTEPPEDPRSALADCMRQAVAQAGLAPEDISAICFAPPSFEWSRRAETDLLESLASAGFRRLPVVGIGLQGCGAIGAAMEIGTALALRRQAPVLIVLSALPLEGAAFDARSMRLFSCGVACAVLAPGEGTYRLLAATTTTDTALACEIFRADAGPAFRESWQLLRAALAELLTAASSEAQDIAFVCGSNINEQALMTIAMAAGVPRERVWSGGLAELGHLYSADALVSLARLEQARRLNPGDRILVVGWSEWVIGGAVLEYLPQPPIQHSSSPRHP